ncbi:uncharacterized protein LOC135216036 [Macrobrachium nipponense]|uniref:uncharacterized protein LOC135216036 n=1 Tax=Macrobrachium nipponense TaxID=159736 RepID=UPI0030C7A80D
MQTALCVLLLTWGAFALPPSLKAARSYAGDETELNSPLDSTKVLLTKVTTFMNRITELTKNSERLTPAEAMTLLPDFVVEAVKLRDELEVNPVKSEDPEAVQRVKDMITMSLHIFAQKHDGQGAAQSDATTTQEPEPPAEMTEQPEAVGEASTDDPKPEVTTIVAPAEDDAEEEAEEEMVEAKNEILEGKPAPTPFPVIRRPFVPVNNPFSNSQAFSFSSPIRSHVQGPAPVIKLLPSGGYYVYYNQGR